MINTNRLRVAALIDLPRSPKSGGHVKGWERLAKAAAESNLLLDLTVYFSGPEMTETLGPRSKIRQLPPVFSTANLKFLPYVPDHTDLAPYHFKLAQELRHFDVLHTTDGFFAFARTAERVSKKYGIPLVTSFHTDTPSYARIFTQHTIERMFGGNKFSRFLVQDLKLPERQGWKMENRLKQHVRACKAALVCRDEDRKLAEDILGRDNVHNMRLGVDRAMFGPHQRNRAAINEKYGIPEGRIAVLFVGRVDVGKNIYTLIEAMEKLIAEGMPLHLITAGIGPAMDDVKRRLGDHASVPGFVAPEDLAKLYASVDALALCSEVEIRSMAGVEAMTSGCPVLVAEKSGVAKLFNNTPAMIVVDGGADAWADALREFTASPGLQQNMYAAAIEHSKKYIAGWVDVLGEDLLTVWQSAAAKALKD